MKRSKYLAPLSLAFLYLSACHDSSSGSAFFTVIDETEPNGTAGQANALSTGRAGHGGVADDTDTDFWSVALTAGQFVSIEVFGSRFDFDTWTTNGNAPSVRLFDTDGTTLLLEQSDESFAWNGDQDTDVLTFRVPTTGTYFLAVDVADSFVNGGEYLVSVEPTTLATPLQFELEPEGMTGANDSSATAEAIAPGTVAGFHVDEETDWYTFDVTAPSLATFTLHGHRNGVWKGDDSYFDPEVRLHSAAFVLDSNDDTFYLDSALHFVINTPGTYFFEVDECCAAGDTGYFFEFTLDEIADLTPVAEVEPNDDTLTAQAVQFGDFIQGTVDAANEDFFAFACNAGDRIHMQVFDLSNFQGATEPVACTLEDSMAATFSTDFGTNLRVYRTILTTSGTFFVRVTSPGATSYALRVTQEPAGFESEPNDDMAGAGTFDANGRAAGLISVMDDTDTFSFTATAGVPVRFETLADDVGPNGFFELDGFGSTLQPVLSVVDATSTVLATASSGISTAVGVKDGLSALSLVFLPPATGTYYVQVTDESSAFGTDAYYVLQKR